MSKLVDSPAEVLRNTPIKSGYHELILRTPEIAALAHPGQFVHVRVPGLGAAALRRPFSIAGAENNQLRILYKSIGRGTDVLAQQREGTQLPMMGPCGNGFPLTPEGTPVLVAGGYGVAPLGFLAQRLPKKGILLVGGRTANDILDTAVFEQLGWSVRIATQDGSLGTKGLVTALFPEAVTAQSELFACGPDGMLKAVGDAAIQQGCKAWLSLDKHMVCSIGACLACVQTLRRADGTEWVGRVCKDGPIFEAREIVW